jgi:hypothetical protein
MVDLNTLLKYPLLLISPTGKRNFSELARMAHESVYSIKRVFSPSRSDGQLKKCFELVSSFWGWETAHQQAWKSKKIMLQHVLSPMHWRS